MIKLCKAHAVGVLNDEGVAVAHVHACLDKRCAHKNIHFAVQQLLPHAGKRGLVHAAVRGGNARARAHLRHMGGALFNGVNAVVNIIGLAAAVQLAPQGLGHKAVVIFHHIGLHRAALYRRLLNGAHVAQAAHGHAQCARNGRGRKRQHIHAQKCLFQLFLVLYAKALFFVHNDKAKVFEFHIFLQKAVCAHNKVYRAVRKAAQGGAHLLLRGKAG